MRFRLVAVALALLGGGCVSDILLGGDSGGASADGASGDAGAPGAPLEPGGRGGQGGASSEPCELVASGPVVVDEPGQVVENLDITADGQAGLRILVSDVTVRRVRVRHRGGPGIVIEGADRVTIQDVVVDHVGAPDSGPNDDLTFDNVACFDSNELVLTRARLVRGSSGAFLTRCAGARLSFVEGHDFRGPFNHGQFVRFEASADGLLQDFSVENPESAWTENNVHVSESADVTILRGSIDGNNSPQGHGVLFSGSSATGVVEDVDAIRMGNGCFSAYTGGDGVVFRRTRCRENICTDQGRGLPTSGGAMWTGDETQSALVLEDSVFFDACVESPVWPESAFATLDLREEDFALRPPLRLSFCFD